jgi:hypothetical protein
MAIKAELGDTYYHRPTGAKQDYPIRIVWTGWNPEIHIPTGRRRLKKMHHPILTKISSNPVHRHLLVAVTRVCVLLVFMISLPLLYCTSTQVVASSFVTTLFTIALIGLTNKQHPSPSFPFDPSPPVVLHKINRATFPPKYSSRCTTFT